VNVDYSIQDTSLLSNTPKYEPLQLTRKIIDDAMWIGKRTVVNMLKMPSSLPLDFEMSHAAGLLSKATVLVASGHEKEEILEKISLSHNVTRGSKLWKILDDFLMRLTQSNFSSLIGKDVEVPVSSFRGEFNVDLFSYKEGKKKAIKVFYLPLRDESSVENDAVEFVREMKTSDPTFELYLIKYEPYKSLEIRKVDIND
ncbi:MAG: hypothetical protein QXL15_04200, partial [Candidatus Korarchaeota archaeon]